MALRHNDMKYINLSKFQGVIKDYHSRMIPDEKNSDCLNVEYEHGRVKTRMGYLLLEAGLPLDGMITHMVEFERINTGERFFVVFTEEDAYVYNDTYKRFDVITPQFSEGAIYSVSPGDGFVTITIHDAENYPAYFIEGTFKVSAGLNTARISVDVDQIVSVSAGVVSFTTIQGHVFFPIYWDVGESFEDSMGYVDDDITAIGTDGVNGPGIVQFRTDGILPEQLNDENQYYGYLVDHRVAIYELGTENIIFDVADNFSLILTLEYSNLVSFASDNSGHFCFVGNGLILSSDDLGDFVSQVPADSYPTSFLSVCYGSSLWVIVGDQGEIQTSTDRETWTHIDNDGLYSGSFFSIKYNNSVFMAVGSNGEIQTSVSGNSSWTHRDNDGSYTGWFYSSCYGDLGYVVVGENGEIQSSSDLVTFTHRYSNADYIFSDVIFDDENDIYIAIGFNTTFYSGIILISSNLADWELVYEGDEGYFLSDIAVYNGDIIVSGLKFGPLFSISGVFSVYSNDGENWNVLFEDDSGNMIISSLYDDVWGFCFLCINGDISAGVYQFDNRSLYIDNVNELVEIGYSKITTTVSGSEEIWSLEGHHFPYDRIFEYDVENGRIIPDGILPIGEYSLQFSLPAVQPESNGAGTHFITVTEYLQNVTDGFPYLLRQCFTSDLEALQDTAIAYDDNELDNILLVTNGVEDIQKWTGDGSLQRLGYRDFSGDLSIDSAVITNVSGIDALRIGMYVSGHPGLPSEAMISDISASLAHVTLDNPCTMSDTDIGMIGYNQPNKAKFIDFFGSIGYEHIVTASTFDGEYQLKQTLDFSDAGEVDLWNNIFYDLLDSPDEIVGVKKLQTRLIIYKKNSISEAYPNPTGGNSDPFDIIQNKISIGTPSIRTVVDFGDYHIFYGWDNFYIFDGASVIPIGTDIINDLNSGLNREFANRAFSFAIKNKNLYICVVPFGFGQEVPNRAYIFNYFDKTWAIWHFSNSFVCHGTFHKSNSVTWEQLLVPEIKESSAVVSGSNILTVPDVANISVGMVVEDGLSNAYIPSGTNIISMSSNTELIMSNVALQNNSDFDAEFYKSWNNMMMRCEELLVYEDDESHFLGSEDGNIYEISDRYTNDDGTAFNSYFITKDYPLNDVKQWFKFLQTVIGICNEIEGSFSISVSVDFGNTWTDAIEVDVAQGVDYVEHIIHWIERGRQVRLKFENISGSYFSIESVIIGFEDAGITNIQGV